MALLLVMVIVPGHLQAAIEVGKVQFVRGAVTAQIAGDALRVLGKDAPIFKDDILTIASISFAVLELNDGTRISLRPDTVIKINEYSEQSGQENVSIHLYKGGLRLISGFISKLNPDAFKVTTSVSTIGISGTELDARLCQADCASEAAEKETPGVELPTSSVVGRVAFLRGDLTSTNAAGTIHHMAKGGPLFNDEE